MTWKDIKWGDYLAFLECPDNLDRFRLLGGMTKKDFMEDDDKAIKLYGLNNDTSFMQAPLPKHIDIKARRYKIKSKTTYQFGIVAMHLCNEFLEKGEVITEKLYADLAAIHLQNDFTEEEESEVKERIMNMSVYEFWPIGNFFFQKYSKYLCQLMSSQNDAMLSEINSKV